jgi:probable rRNA maturation factor
MVIEVASDNSWIKTKQDSLKRIIQWICKQLVLPVKSVSVIFTDNQNIQSLHHQYFNENTPTDVITFNLGNAEKIEAEIYINEDYTQKQAEYYGVTFIEEISRLLVHAMLHLAGYDDLTDENRKNMRREEDKYVKYISEKYLN